MRKRRKHIVPYLFVAPAILFYSIFFIGSVIFSFYISLTRWNALQPLKEAPWAGWGNYQFLLTRDDLFWLTLKNSFVITLWSLVFGLSISLALAFLIHRAPFKTFWRVIYFLPVVTTVVAVGNIWRYILGWQDGILNTFLREWGLPTQRWMTDPATAIWPVVGVSIWAGLGGGILIFSAALEAIPEEYYEAARIDGAGTWQEFWHITLPLIRPALLFQTITGFVGGIQGFALVQVMTGGGPVDATRVFALRMYEVAFEDLRFGRASAMVFLLFVIILVISLIQLRIFRRGGVESY